MLNEMWLEDIQGSTAFGLMVVISIIIVAPVIAQKLGMPPLVGLLLGGALIGPNMLDVLPSFDKLEAFGGIGVLYLIFLAGLGLDLRTFVENAKTSTVFSVFTSVFPWAFGTLAALLFGYGTLAALLIGSFWASFTLVSYGVVTRFDLTRMPSVTATVGASAMTDTIGLVALAILIGTKTGEASTGKLVLELALGLLLLGAYCLFLFPRICRWCFAGIGQEREVRYLMLLTGLLSASVVAEILGIEPLIGAFFVGLGLNPLVPNQSTLMARTDFVGNAIFIPTFLISVGLMIDPAMMLSLGILGMAAAFSLALMGGKAIAAWITGRIYDLPRPEVGLMFCLSSAQAAATLAATIIGYNAGLYGGEVINAVMVVIVVSVLVSSFGATYFAPRIEKPEEVLQRLGETILVPVTGSGEMTGAFRLAGAIAEYDGGHLIPLVVTVPEEEEDLRARRGELRSLTNDLRGLGLTGDPELRVDRSIAGGVHRATLEKQASLVLLSWPGHRDIRTRLLGGTLDEIASQVTQPVVLSTLRSRGKYRRLLLAVQPRDLQPGQTDELRTALALAEAVGEVEGLDVRVGPVTVEQIREAGHAVPLTFQSLSGLERRRAWITQHAAPSDVVVALAGRQPFELLEGPLSDERLSFALVTTHHDPAFYSAQGTLAATGVEHVSPSTTYAPQ